MQRVCAWCKTALHGPVFDDDTPVSHGICLKCAGKFQSDMKVPINQFLDGFAEPIVVVNPDGRVSAANQSAMNIVGKSFAQIEGFPGGDVFECEHSFLPDGCGRSEHCVGCSIRRTVMECMADGKGRANTSAILSQRTANGTKIVRLKITTEKVGSVVLLRLDSAESH